MFRWIFFMTVCLLVAGCQSEVHTASPAAKQRIIEKSLHVENETVPTLVKPAPLELTIVLKKNYIDGVTETTKKVETIWSMIDFWAEYEGWTVTSQTLEQITFQKNMKDISPLTKKAGYFGLTKSGELAVFQGRPVEGKVIESFKPVPVKPLESKRKTNLEKGIKIKDLQHFEQVISQFSTQNPI